MLFVVCYDISADPTRNQMSVRLLDYGVRIQESVFECLLDDDGYRKMLGSLDRVPIAKTDRVRVYRLCQRCVETVRIFGPGELTRDPDYYVV